MEEEVKYGNCSSKDSALASVEEIDASLNTIFDWSVSRKCDNVAVMSYNLRIQIGELRKQIENLL